MFNDNEIEVLKACFEFIRSGNIGFEAIDENTTLDFEEFEDTIESLKDKFD